MITEKMIAAALEAALKADIIPMDDPKHDGVRINDYLQYTPADAVELGVHLTEKTSDGKPRWHGYSDIMGDEHEDTNRAILGPLIKAGLEAALSTDAEPVGHPQFEARMRDAIRFTVRETLGFVNAEIVNELFNNVTAVINHCAPPQPAPSVAVKALLDEVWNAAVEKAAAIADDCVHLTPDPGAAIKAILNGRAKLYPASEAALSAQVQDVAIPEGWQMVPKNPSEEMLTRGKGSGSGSLSEYGVLEVWNDMLSAAPTAKQGEAE